ncbi:MAG: glycosyltransferase family 9 protein [Betaproteobacteria bacterium]|nr:glycosyltransferase family 9 protein [Betaproteobacteria bacterium]
MKNTQLWIIFVLHVLSRVFRQPSWLRFFVRQTRKSWQCASWHGVKEYWLGDYLLRNYLAKTRFILREPSPSIYKKLPPLLGKDFFSLLQAGPGGMSKKPRLLVIRSGAMGDVLLCTPIVRQMYKDRQGYCDIDVVTRYPELFANNPYIAEVLNWNDLKYNDRHYDFILNLDMSQEKNRALHITDVYAFQAFGVRDFDKQPEIFSTAQDKSTVNHYIESVGQTYIVVHNRHDPNQPHRHVDATLWRELLSQLAYQSGLPILQIGSPALDMALDFPGAVDVRGLFSIQQTRELIAQSKLFVGFDAGPLHIAATTQVPIVAFFTLVDHSLRAPLRRSGIFVPIAAQIDCYGCAKEYPLPWGFACRRGDSQCAKSFAVESTLFACLKILKES